MFCPTLLVTAQCLFLCEGLLSEFNNAWNWPASIRWGNNTQALVDDSDTFHSYTVTVTT
jgi:hypothetical protein